MNLLELNNDVLSMIGNYVKKDNEKRLKIDRYETNTYKVQNDVLKAYVNRILRGFRINEEVHSIIVNFDFHPLESEIDYNEMWIEFKNESDELIARIYNDYILKIYVYDLICAKVRKVEIKAIFNDLQERTNKKIIDYFRF